MPPVGKPGFSKKAAITQRWGWAKRKFIDSLYEDGASLYGATQLWNKRRTELKKRGVTYPSESDIVIPPRGTRGPFDNDPERYNEHQHQPGEESPSGSFGDLNAADLREIDELERAYLESEIAQIDDAVKAQGAETHRDIHGKGYSKKFIKRPATPDSPEQEVLAPDTPTALHSKLRKVPDGNEDEVIPESPGTPMSGPRAGPSHAISSSSSSGGGSPPYAPEVMDISPPNTPAGGGAPGNNATHGQGGSGGGLAGAGNNTLFKGFAGSTKINCPKGHTYEQTYKRPFAIHTEFPAPTEDHAATIYTAVEYFHDRDAASIDGYGSGYVVADCDHGGVFVPYWFVEASMKEYDWNVPNDHIGYEVVEFGFNIPNLRLSVMNNDREEVTQVAPAPPADARMWMFVDTFNDYGIMNNHDVLKCTHSSKFTEEDIVVAEYDRYALPTLGARYFVLDPTVTEHMIHSQWTAGTGLVFSTDANSLYDMKRHPGYKEFTLSSVSMGMKYTPNSPMVRFPHPSTTSLDLGARIQDKSYTYTYAAGTPHVWQTITEQPLVQDTSTESQAIETAQYQFYCYNLSAYTKDLLTTDPISAVETAAKEQFGSLPVRVHTNPAVALPLTTANVRTSGRYDINDEGTWHSKHISKRPPIFTFGVHKELEDQSTGTKFWRYYCYGQVEYYVKIRWHVDPECTKPYLPIGIGGFYTQWDGGAAIKTNKVGRPQTVAARKLFRKRMYGHANSTAFERPSNTKLHF